MSSRVLTAAVAATLLAAAPRAAAGGPHTLQIFSSVDGGRATPEWKYVRLGQRVLLEARGLPAALPASLVRWFRLEPSSAPLDNTQPSFHFEPVDYRAVELAGCRGALACPADVRASDPGLWGGLDGVGAMAFQVEAALPDGTILRSPGAESREQGGLSRSVHRVAVRRDDSYLGMLTELFQTPYIFGSDGPAGRHQAELLIGSDCADLVVYGARRLGARVPFTSTWTLERHAPRIAVATSESDRVAVGEGGLRPGDLLLFPSTRHVAVLYEDRPPLGLLGPGDFILHTCWASPRVEALGATGCASYPIRVLRFPAPFPR